MSFLKSYYGPTEGPLGFPMTDRAARALDDILRTLPKSDEFAYRKAVSERGPAELLAGERSDVSWITSEEPDRANEIVLARGMDDSQFKLNPIVTLQHAYWLPPVGKSLWRRVVRDGPRSGVKAKTLYPPCPATWSGAPWPPDTAFALVQADLLRGKSIGFLPTKVHTPSQTEREQPGWEHVALVIDQWVLLEYACCYLPCQQNAVVEAVSKSVPIPEAFRQALGIEPESAALPAVPFTTLAEIESAFRRALAAINPAEIARTIMQSRLDQLRGRI